MRKEEFKAWLENRHPNKNTVVTNTLSRCRKVEDYYGDLDKKYRKDRCWGIIDDLNYTVNDEKAGNLPRHKIPIGGNIKNCSASYKSAVRLYLEFCSDDKVLIHRSDNTDTTNAITTFKFENKSKLHLRQKDEFFETIEDFDEFIVSEVVGFSKDNDDANNYNYLASKYFLSVEGIWFVKDLETNTCTKIVPSKRTQSPKLKEYLDELIKRNELDLIDYLKKNWAVEKDDINID